MLFWLRNSKKFLRKDVSNILEEYKKESSYLFCFFRHGYRYLLREIQSFYEEDTYRRSKTIIQDLEQLIEYNNSILALEQLSPKAQELFGKLWKAEKVILLF